MTGETLDNTHTHTFMHNPNHTQVAMLLSNLLHSILHQSNRDPNHSYQTYLFLDAIGTYYLPSTSKNLI